MLQLVMQWHHSKHYEVSSRMQGEVGLLHSCIWLHLTYTQGLASQLAQLLIGCDSFSNC